MSKIKNIKAREIIDSRSYPTLETTVFLDNGLFASAAVPSGASKGTHEALELRDSDPKRFNGLGVTKAVNHVNSDLKPLLLGLDATNQAEIDGKMLIADGTVNKNRLGANSILSVSLACARVAALAQNLPLYRYLGILFGNREKLKLPFPCLNLINGGLHAHNHLDFQEFMVVPCALKFSDNLRLGIEIYQQLKKILEKENLGSHLGDEGGFAPTVNTSIDALTLLQKAIQESVPSSEKISLGLDLASSNFYSQGKYQLREIGKVMETAELIEYLASICRQFKIHYLEDALSEDDWPGWQKLTQKLGQSLLLVGDDLLATNPERLKKAIDKKACNSILIKVNQIGSLSETLKVIHMAKEAGFKIVISHRSGETNDSFIADLAVGVNADYAKFGAPARGERVAKYNRLWEIETELNN